MWLAIMDRMSGGRVLLPRRCPKIVSRYERPYIVAMLLRRHSTDIRKRRRLAMVCGSVTNVTGCSTGCIADRRLVRTDKITIVSMEGRGIDKTSMPAARSKLSCGESSLPSG
ncbi:hypothetical protein CC77DRAFT_709868 [Alternaria alternata]|uniref:Uncharacterized protein n=1 Tax=Alternaria alternata TaxID=5599 RepID=A0A177DVV6_ALTAL|nr:hypothetical protein CC77DRAFT_709868 [Alternaria alternata]OAG23320.1 hypothetical protein CC77DRAFT_709868 [Alternaria alternata]